MISEVSEFELNFAPTQVKRILKFIPPQYLEIARFTDEAQQLSEYYIKEKIVTKKSMADTQHIAIATLHQVDLLVSWNFKHIVNFDKIRLYNSVILKYGYKVLEIRSPRDIANEW
jgi:hypothetical protein